MMTLRQEIIRTIKTINPGFLSQIYNLTENLIKMEIGKKKVFTEKTHPLFKFVGSIDNAEAQELKAVINKEFSQIEGDW